MKDQGARADLAGGDVKVGIDRKGWNDDDPRWRRWNSITPAVFRRAGDRRGVGVWSMSCAGVMWFRWYTCRARGTIGAADRRRAEAAAVEELTGVVVRLRGCEGTDLSWSRSFSGLRWCRWGTYFSVRGGGGG
jgi:hypothetical protein